MHGHSNPTDHMHVDTPTYRLRNLAILGSTQTSGPIVNGDSSLASLETIETE